MRVGDVGVKVEAQEQRSIEGSDYDRPENIIGGKRSVTSIYLVKQSSAAGDMDSNHSTDGCCTSRNCMAPQGFTSCTLQSGDNSTTRSTSSSPHQPALPEWLWWQSVAKGSA